MASFPEAVPTVTVTTLPAGARLLDVREPEEWAAGHVAGSVHLPLSEFAGRVGEVPPADGTPLVVVCRSGHRSAAVAAWLAGAGWDAANLDGGLVAWQAAGRPLVTPDGRPGAVF